MIIFADHCEENDNDNGNDKQIFINLKTNMIKYLKKLNIKQKNEQLKDC